MPPQARPAKSRTEVNLTAASTLDHLIIVSLACAVLWAIIVATFGV